MQSNDYREKSLAQSSNPQKSCNIILLKHLKEKNCHFKKTQKEKYHLPWVKKSGKSYLETADKP